MKRVGIIGGMGPAASLDLYAKITSLSPATKDQEHIPLVIDSNPQIPDRSAFLLGRGEDPLPYMLASANRLKNAGCEAIAIACNTAHYFADEIQSQSGLEVLHIAKIATKALKENFPNAKDVAVIATTGTINAGIYDKILAQNGLNSLPLSPQSQYEIMSCIYDGVKAGEIKRYVPTFRQCLAGIHADVFIAACTEIPLFLPYLDENIRALFVDATLELAREIVKFANS